LPHVGGSQIHPFTQAFASVANFCDSERLDDSA
jgi:hypothetical protein